MSDSGTTEPERRPQGAFRLADLAGLSLLLLAIGGFDRFLDSVPNREELGPTAATLQFIPITLDARRLGPFRLAGAWELRGKDPRIGGISALAIDGGDLLALSDSGVLIRFSPPKGGSAKAKIRELPDGPGSGRFKRNRDSEALASDPQGRGWWVAFENRHELWLYDREFTQLLERIELGRGRWPANKGVEAIVPTASDLLLFPEDGRSIRRITDSRGRSVALADASGRISDGAAIGPDRAIAVERRLTPFGFRNRLVSVKQDGGGYRLTRIVELPLRPIDNVEAIAVEQRPDGGRRLWLMTDDNFQRPLRTLLIALDLAEGEPGSNS